MEKSKKSKDINNYMLLKKRFL